MTKSGLRDCAQGGGPRGRLRFVLGVLVSVFGAVVAGAQPTPIVVPSASPSAPALPALPLPSDLFTLSGAGGASRPAQQKAVAGLLRGLETVAGAEVLITGEAAAPAVSGVLRPRGGRRLTPETVEAAARLMLGAVPGLTPRQLLLTSSQGQVLYATGEVRQPATTGETGSPGLLWAGALALGLLGTAVVYRRRHRTASHVAVRDDWGFVGRLSPTDLARLLEDEPADLGGVLCLVASAPVARHLERYARRRRLAWRAPAHRPEPEVWQALLTALRRKARQQGMVVEE